MTRQECRRAIRAFLQTEVWTDEKLCQLLAHAETKLAFISCCCLIGVATADHALKGQTSDWFASHHQHACKLPLALEAQTAYLNCAGSIMGNKKADADRRRILRPIIRAELRRRELLRQSVVQSNSQEEVYATI